MDCLFCKIAAGQIPSAKVYEDETVYAFRDIAPQAPVHVLIIPKEHIESLQAVSEAQLGVLAHMFAVAQKIAVSEGVDKTGYRVISNIGDDAGQSVKHLHVHLIGGKQLKWDN